MKVANTITTIQIDKDEWLKVRKDWEKIKYSSKPIQYEMSEFKRLYEFLEYIDSVQRNPSHTIDIQIQDPDEIIMVPAPVIIRIEYNQPLTRSYIRSYLSQVATPKRNVDIINTLYPNKSKEQKSELIRQLSVMLNKLEHEGEILRTREVGTKGHYYEIIKNQ